MCNGFAGLDGVLTDGPVRIDADIDAEGAITARVNGITSRLLSKELRGCHA